MWHASSARTGVVDRLPVNIADFSAHLARRGRSLAQRTFNKVRGFGGTPAGGVTDTKPPFVADRDGIPPPDLSGGANSRKPIPGARVQIIWGGGRSETLIDNDDCGSGIAGGSPLDSLSELPDRKGAISNTIIVVTPSFNSGAFIDSTITSVIAQEGDFRIRYHVQDGGSTDGTIDRLKRWQELLADESCPLVRCQGVEFSFVSTPDSGMYDAIQRGFEAVTRTSDSVITWINADDVFHFGAFAAALATFNANPDCHWLIAATNAGGQHQEELSSIAVQFPRELIAAGLCDHQHWQFIQQEGSFWSNELWETVGGLDTSYRLAGDWDLWRRFAHHTTPVQLLWPLAKFRMHDDQQSYSATQDYYAEINAVLPEKERLYCFRRLAHEPLRPMRLVRRSNNRLSNFNYESSPLLRNLTLRQPVNDTWLKAQIKDRLPQDLRVLTFSTLSEGGAGTGSFRRVVALREAGVDAQLLSLVSKRKNGFVGRIVPAIDALDCRDQNAVWRHLLETASNPITKHAAFAGREIFTTTNSLIDFRQLKPLIEKADILHFHWASGMLDFPNLAAVVRDKPIVWTTADMNPFTGGCHYSEGCEGYTESCAHCPMTGRSSLTSDLWQQKKRAYDALDITVVCPSEYIAEKARRSSLFGDKKIVVIPNAYPIDVMQPRDRAAAREELKLPQDKKLIMFASQDLTNTRKGGDLLVEVARRLHRTRWPFEVEVICTGSGNMQLPLNVWRTGTLGTSSMPLAYSAADVFVSLSREDVGPMTVVEALLCGTPVVGFDVGVLPEIALEKRTAITVPQYDTRGIVAGIRHFLEGKDAVADLPSLCRTTAVRYGDPTISAKRHIDLYHELVQRRSS